MTADTQLYFDHLRLGGRWESPSCTINNAHFAFFAGLSGDNHPIHYEYAKKSPLGAGLAHGLLLMGLTAVGASPLSHWLHSR